VPLRAAAAIAATEMTLLFFIAATFVALDDLGDHHSAYGRAAARGYGNKSRSRAIKK